MASKSQKRQRNRGKQTGAPPPGEERYTPKAGPGQVFKRELIGAETGHAKRYRNVGESAMALAYHRGKLAGPDEGKGAPLPGQITADDRLHCGEKFEKWWYVKQASPSRDSLNPGVGGGSGSFWTENQEAASDSLARVRARMAPKNFMIVQAFCGEGHQMPDALRFAGVEAHPVGTAFRIREALDDLVCAVTGQLPVPILLPAAGKRA